MLFSSQTYYHDIINKKKKEEEKKERRKKLKKDYLYEDSRRTALASVDLLHQSCTCDILMH